MAAAGLSTPLGMLVPYPVVSRIEGEPLSLVALAAGVSLAVAIVAGHR